MDQFEYTTEIIQKMQRIEFDMLCELDRICKKHNISYQLDGGTFLGAVRHKGFIPWDDDIDVRMLRSEYERFCEVCESELDKNKYFLQNHETDPGSLWAYARILRVGTSFYRQNQEMLTMRRGIFIDIFPCDGMPEKPFPKCLFNLRCLLARKILYARVGAVHENNQIKRTGYKILRLISVEFAYRIIENLIGKFKNEDTLLVRTIGWGAPEENRGFKREWMLKSQMYEFNGMLFPAALDYNGFLTFLFGRNYIQPPPENERYPKHIAEEIDFGNTI